MTGDDPLEADDVVTVLHGPPVRTDGSSAEGVEDATEASKLAYGSVDEWLRDYWRYTYRRRVSAKGSGTGRWRARWWEHDEAVQRLEALWRSWEAARLDPTGMSTWWLNHADPHMTVLLSIDGPFAGSTDENLPGAPLPYQTPPPGMFPSARRGQ